MAHNRNRLSSAGSIGDPRRRSSAPGSTLPSAVPSALTIPLAVALLFSAFGLASCFSTGMDTCEFRCSASHSCPPGYECRGDGYCHQENSVGGCQGGFPKWDGSPGDGIGRKEAQARERSSSDGRQTEARPGDTRTPDALAADGRRSDVRTADSAVDGRLLDGRGERGGSERGGQDTGAADAAKAD
jgi:hypothetical protein